MEEEMNVEKKTAVDGRKVGFKPAFNHAARKIWTRNRPKLVN